MLRASFAQVLHVLLLNTWHVHLTLLCSFPTCCCSTVLHLCVCCCCTCWYCHSHAAGPVHTVRPTHGRSPACRTPSCVATPAQFTKHIGNNSRYWGSSACGACGSSNPKQRCCKTSPVQQQRAAGTSCWLQLVQNTARQAQPPAACRQQASTPVPAVLLLQSTAVSQAALRHGGLLQPRTHRTAALITHPAAQLLPAHSQCTLTQTVRLHCVLGVQATQHTAGAAPQNSKLSSASFQACQPPGTKLWQHEQHSCNWSASSIISSSFSLCMPHCIMQTHHHLLRCIQYLCIHAVNMQPFTH